MEGCSVASYGLFICFRNHVNLLNVNVSGDFFMFLKIKVSMKGLHGVIFNHLKAF
jgi:hypothetical protein